MISGYLTLNLVVFWAESTFGFLVEQWKNHLPSGYLLKEASIDQPCEQDSCRCHFTIVLDSTLRVDPELVLKYQWFVGERSLSNFVAIPDATKEVIHVAVLSSLFKLLNINGCLPTY